jgi:integrase
MGLRPKGIDIDNGIIRVRGAVVPNKRGRLTRKEENKNAASGRGVHLFIPELKTALTNSGGRVMLCTADGARKRISAICEANGLPRVGFRRLRHGFALLAYRLQIPEHYVTQIGGWSDCDTLRRVTLTWQKRVWRRRPAFSKMPIKVLTAPKPLQRKHL